MARSYPRDLTPALQRAARAFGAVVVTGPRRAGKTHLLRATFPDASYHALEDHDVIARVRADPRGWLDDLPATGRVILDEIQHVPELLTYLRTRIDAAPRRTGRWLITGSQDFELMHGVTESMAGRAAILHLLPLSATELGRWDLLRGGFPEIWARPGSAALWFRSYVETYLERDVRAITAVHDLATFRRFVALVASRSAQMVNKTELATPLGVSVPTITAWLSILETTGLVAIVPPYFENFGKRLVKTPKLYLVDTGLLCHLLGITSRAELERSPFLGAVYETFVAQELVKHQVHHARAKELYFFRDAAGLEVDFVVPAGGGGLALIETKWAKTVSPRDAAAIAAVRRATRRETTGYVVHRGGADGALAPGIRAVTIEALLAALPA